MERFYRSELLIGKEGIEKLNNAKVAVFGIGGVGSYVVEALARSGIGNIIIVDKDVVDETNINRQIIALTSTVGLNKVDVMEKRILDINPDAIVKKYKFFFSPDSSHEMIEDDLDYIVDAVDSVSAKVELMKVANEKGIKIISSMGTGNKLNPTQLEIADIYDTEICPLAKVMRKEARNLGIEKMKVVYSKENPIEIPEEAKKEGICGSISFVPSVAGLIIASEVVKDIIQK